MRVGTRNTRPRRSGANARRGVLVLAFATACHQSTSKSSHTKESEDAGFRDGANGRQELVRRRLRSVACLFMSQQDAACVGERVRGAADAEVHDRIVTETKVAAVEVEIRGLGQH